MAEPTFSTPTLLDARLEASREGTSLVLPTQLDADSHRTWEYLTRPVLLEEWAPFVPTRPLDDVGEVKLRQFEDNGAIGRKRHSDVRAVIERKLLAYTWGRDTLTWRIDEAGSGTRLTLTHLMADASDAPSLAAGWHLCLTVLAERLAGRPAQPILGLAALNHGFLSLHDAYRSQLTVR